MAPASPPPKWSRRPLPPETTAGGSGRRRLLLLLLLALLLGLGGMRLFSGSKESFRQSPPPAVVATPVVKPEAFRLVTIFYADATGNGLASEIRKRPLCPDEPACLRDLLVALGENPGSGLLPVLPAGFELKSVVLEGPTATIDLGRHAVAHLPGGVMSERLVLAALVDTLAVNFPQIQQLSVQIDGLPAETLKGHVDLRRPFAADFSLVRRPLQPSPELSGTSIERGN